MRIELTMGQYLDIASTAAGDHAPERAELVTRYKTAYYSVERPLHLGAALAGRLDDFGPHYSAFGLPVGEAFQLRDDLLGALGDESVTGKPVGDDLREGKPTLLVACRCLAGAEGRRLLDGIGDSALTPAEVRAIQRLLVDCGAGAEIESTIAARVTDAVTALDVAPIDEAVRLALRQLALEAAWRNA